jgi:signal transduction histidine kinase
MRRLHLQLYLAIVGTLLAFLFAAGLVWHVASSPQSAVWGVETATQLSAALLDKDASTGADPRTILAALSYQVHADVALLAADGIEELSTGRMFEFTPEQRAEPGWHLRAGPSYGIRLGDGRMLLVHPRHRFLLHGLHMVLILGTIAACLAFLTYPITRGITARLGRLEHGVRSFGEGNLAARVAVEGRDEIAALARSFNDSAERIERLMHAHQMLLANCSHELRTPLTRMRLAIDQLAKNDSHARAEVSRNIAELDALIGELLLTSRLDAARELERAQDIDLLALAAEEAAHFDREVCGEAVTVTGDPLLLRRLIRNLLENARVHAGGASEIRVSGNDDHAQIVVEDRGDGVPPEASERIFEPFYRRAQTASTTGSGLGLAIVRQIARAHGGDATHAPREGGGSRFIITLPLRQR